MRSDGAAVAGFLEDHAQKRRPARDDDVTALIESRHEMTWWTGLTQGMLRGRGAIRCLEALGRRDFWGTPNADAG
jgi:hypothetical protein